MKVLLLVVVVVVVVVVVPAASAHGLPSSPSAPTSYIDVRQSTTFEQSGGGVESTYLFRVPASGSTFSSPPPMGMRWTEGAALTGQSSPWSSSSSPAHPAHRLLLPPEADPLLCEESYGAVDYAAADAAPGGYEGSYVLAPRGRCSFEAKARSAQRLGASGIIIRNTLESRYDVKREGGDGGDVVDAVVVVEGDGSTPDWTNTIWPTDMYDYECGTNGHARDGYGIRSEVDPTSLDFDPPPYGGDGGAHNDQLLSGPAVDGNLCALGATMMTDDGSSSSSSSSFESRCPSMRCLLTGRNGTIDESRLEACCAWDVLMVMGSDGDDGKTPGEEDVVIPCLFVTMEKGTELYDLVTDAYTNNAVVAGSARYVEVVPYARWRPPVHYSTLLLWSLAIFALWSSARRSAREYGER